MKKLLKDGENVIGITNGHISLQICSSQEADTVLKEQHYSHKCTRNRFLSFKINNGNGYLQLGYGIRPLCKKNISIYITPKNYCEFDRMWLSDELPKNSETQVISLLLSFIKQTMPHIKFVITYADESVGNKGIIYKASNAIYLGYIYVDFYKLPSGERIHPITIWHRHKTRKMSVLQNIYPNIEHICKKTSGAKQHRFLYVLNKKIADKVLRETRLRSKQEM